MMHVSMCLFITYPFTYLSTTLSIHLSINLSIHLFIYLSICMSIYSSVYLSIYLSMYRSIYLSQPTLNTPQTESKPNLNRSQANHWQILNRIFTSLSKPETNLNQNLNRPTRSVRVSLRVLYSPNAMRGRRCALPPTPLQLSLKQTVNTNLNQF